jgi:hypothetical protein
LTVTGISAAAGCGFAPVFVPEFDFSEAEVSGSFAIGAIASLLAFGICGRHPLKEIHAVYP